MLEGGGLCCGEPTGLTLQECHGPEESKNDPALSTRLQGLDLGFPGFQGNLLWSSTVTARVTATGAGGVETRGDESPQASLGQARLSEHEESKTGLDAAYPCYGLNRVSFQIYVKLLPPRTLGLP